MQTLLSQPFTADRCPNFLALCSKRVEPETLTALTPQLMQWSDHVWLLDLTWTQRYWQTRATAIGQSAAQLIEQSLAKLLAVPPEALQVSGAAAPWPALLLLRHMQERRLTGCIQQHSAFGFKLYQQLAWSTWLRAAASCTPHFTRLNGKPKFNAAQFKQQCRTLSAMLQRLQVQSLAQLRTALGTSDLSSAWHRRFGKTLAQLWSWSWNTDYAGFPWLGWAPPVRPQVDRHLDEALWQWDAMVPLLIEDFDRLSIAIEEGARVTQLNWELRAEAGAQTPDAVSITIRFRNPHALQKERGSHPTALVQAKLAFEHQAPKGEETFLLNGWSLSATERLQMPQVLRDLFGEATASAAALELLELENQLPVPLELYESRADWLPEEAYQPPPTTKATTTPNLTPWLRTARMRPLFIYAEPRPLRQSAAKPADRETLLERVSTKWWRTGYPVPEYRDYFRRRNPYGEEQWVFRDHAGAWYVHGMWL